MPMKRIIAYCFTCLILAALLVGCGQVVRTEQPSATAPSGPAPSTPAEVSPPAAESKPAVEQPVTARYDPLVDLELISAGLSRAKLSAEGDNYAEVAAELRNVGTLVACLESHLPSVVLDVGSQRIGLHLDQNDLEGAKQELRQLFAEVASIPALSQDSELQSRLNDLQTSLTNGDTVKAKELLGQLASVADDPAYGDIQAIRAGLLGAMDAAMRQPPKKRVVLAELEGIEELVARVRQSVQGAAAQPSSATVESGKSTIGSTGQLSSPAGTPSAQPGAAMPPSPTQPGQQSPVTPPRRISPHTPRAAPPAATPPAAKPIAPSSGRAAT